MNVYDLSVGNTYTAQFERLRDQGFGQFFDQRRSVAQPFALAFKRRRTLVIPWDNWIFSLRQGSTIRRLTLWS
jgi:hypothetical protein